MLPRIYNHCKRDCIYYKWLFKWLFYFACKELIAPLDLIMVIFWLCNLFL